jgi:hypothetical protein
MRGRTSRACALCGIAIGSFFVVLGFSFVTVGSSVLGLIPLPPLLLQAVCFVVYPAIALTGWVFIVAAQLVAPVSVRSVDVRLPCAKSRLLSPSNFGDDCVVFLRSTALACGLVGPGLYAVFGVSGREERLQRLLFFCCSLVILCFAVRSQRRDLQSSGVVVLRDILGYSAIAGGVVLYAYSTTARGPVAELLALVQRALRNV